MVDLAGVVAVPRVRVQPGERTAVLRRPLPDQHHAVFEQVRAAVSGEPPGSPSRYRAPCWTTVRISLCSATSAAALAHSSNVHSGSYSPKPGWSARSWSITAYTARTWSIHSPDASSPRSG
ncbi:hypothetical protein [Amycolatopsis sp. NPDC051071]|uniref:hypothetical protein n=1 Tax=Amycolatopsis sp. NPDC051071 TaxID=3154637 RepID=UPI0034260C85